METIQVRRRVQPIEHDIENDDELYVTRMPSSTRRYRSAPPVEQEAIHEPASQNGVLIQRRRSSLSPKRTSGIASSAISAPETHVQRSAGRFPLIAILIGVVFTIVLFMSLTALGSWWHAYQDDLHYGRPRTSQLDAIVGHSDSASHPTHFIFLNLNRHVEIIEIPGGDATHMRVFMGPILFGDGQDLTPVTGEIRDVNGDGKPDLIVHILNEQIVFLNDGTTFRPQ